MDENKPSDAPRVEPGAWVHVGKPGRPAVVCDVPSAASPGEIEVVYLDDRNRAINDDVVWRDGSWEFKYAGPSGGYADNVERLQPYVSILRQGRKRP